MICLDHPLLSRLRHLKRMHKNYEVKDIILKLEHHFVFGNDRYADNLISVQKHDFCDPCKGNTSDDLYKINPRFLRASHFTLGDHSQEAVNQYGTTYSITMQPKDAIKTQASQVLSTNPFRSSANIIGTDKNSYLTESRAK